MWFDVLCMMVVRVLGPIVATLSWVFADDLELTDMPDHAQWRPRDWK